jgi:hypothetical protein
MSKEAKEQAALECDRQGNPSRQIDQHDFPNHWCFGLAHPAIQRLIFLAGVMEETAIVVDGSQNAPGS